MQKIFNELVKLLEHPAGRALLYVIAAYIAFRILLWAVRVLYGEYTAKHMVCLKIILPREESPKDQEKKTEKDFREKIAIMEQFYRSIYEIHELTIWNKMKTWFFKTGHVSFELVTENKLVNFYLFTPPEYRSIIEKQITAYYPSADIQEAPKYEIQPKGNILKCFYAYEKRPFWFPVKTYKTIENDPLNDLTNIFSKMTEQEIAAIQIVLRPRNPRWAKKAESVGNAMFQGRKIGWFTNIPILGYLNSILVGVIFGAQRVAPVKSSSDYEKGYIRMLQTREEATKKIGEKAVQVGFDTVIRLAASAPQASRASELINSMSVAFSLFKAADLNWFQTRRAILIDSINNIFLKRRFQKRILDADVPLFREKVSIMVPEELAGLFHFPSSIYNYTPMINWLAYKVLPPPPDMPREGLMLGYNSFRGIKTEVRVPDKDRMRHHYIIGKSGTGKSNLLSYMARQDIIAGKGVGVIDPHGDLIEDILQYIPKERVKDVIFFDPSDLLRPMGLNILEAKTPEQQDLASTQATEIFIKLFGDEIFGPRIQHYFRNACLTLMEDEEEGATLIDVPRIFVDFDFMKYKVAKVKNPVVKSFWEHEYAQTGERERQEMIPYFSAKFGPFITNTIMRNTIGQKLSAFNFRECMDQGKILLVSLAKGKIGDLNTQLLGLVIVSRLQMAAMSRTDIPEKDRKDFYLYVDEFQNFATESFCSILSEARKYHLALIMAHQYINQLVVTKFGVTSTQIRDAVFGNVGSFSSFKVGAEDAEYISKEYAPVLTEQDVINIANFKMYTKVSINNTTCRPFSVETIYDTTNQNSKIAEIVKQYSRLKYGRKREFVDSEIHARIGIEVSQQP